MLTPDIDVVGYWWDASDENKKHYGKLTFDQENGGNLTIMGTFKNILPSDINIQTYPNAIKDDKLEEKKFIQKIFGITDLGKYITLTMCYESHFEYTLVKDLVVYNTRFVIVQAMVGVHFDNHPVSSIDIEFSLLDKWISNTTIGGSFENTFAYFGTNSQEEETYSVNNEIILSLKKDPKVEVMKSAGLFKSASLKSELILEAKLQAKQNLEDYLQLITTFQIFYCLILGKPLEIVSIKFRSEKYKIQLSDGNIVYPTINIHQIIDKKVSLDIDINSFALIKHNQIKNIFGQLLNNYFKNYGKYKICFDLFFSSFYNIHESIDIKFLNYMHALETLHSIMFPENTELTQMEYTIFLEKIQSIKFNDKELKTLNLKHINGISLMKRLTEIIKHIPEIRNTFKNGTTITSFVFKIVQTRNYYTHHDDELRNEILLDENLEFAVKKLQLILHFYLLILLGLQPVQILNVMSGSDEYRDRSLFEQTKEQIS